MIHTCGFCQTLHALARKHSGFTIVKVTKLYKKNPKHSREPLGNWAWQIKDYWSRMSLSWLDNYSKLQQHACSVPVVPDFKVASVFSMSITKVDTVKGSVS